MSVAQLKVASDTEAEYEATKLARYSQMRIDGDARNRLPREFIEAAAEAVAFAETGLTHKSLHEGGFSQVTRNRKTFSAALERARSAFNPAVFEIDDSEEDKLNGGKLLKVSIDFSKADLSGNMVPIAHDAVRQKIGWMGYSRTDKGSGDGTKIGMVYPAYGR